MDFIQVLTNLGLSSKSVSIIILIVFLIIAYFKIYSSIKNFLEEQNKEIKKDIEKIKIELGEIKEKIGYILGKLNGITYNEMFNNEQDK
jgi:cell division protein YceG involved in septum cleavage